MQQFFSGFIGGLHFYSAMAALVFGALVLFYHKGTKLHRTVGYLYFSSMLILNLSALPIQRMSGGIGPFHIFVLISLPTVLAALYFPLCRRTHPNWLWHHSNLMVWSYIGLVSAFMAETMVRLPFLLWPPTHKAAAGNNLWIAVSSAILCAFLVAAIGSAWWKKQRNKILGQHLPAE